MSEYLVGHIKRDSVSGDVAIRTIFPEDKEPQLAALAWLIAASRTGARHAKTEEVDGWTDLFEPDA